VPRANRRSTNFFSRDNSTGVKGVPWDQAVQKVLDNHQCGSCHNGQPAAYNKFVTLTDDLGNSQTYYFNLTGGQANIAVGGQMISAYTWSHLSLLGTMTLELEKKGITQTGDMPIYVNPEDAHGSLLFQYLNPKETINGTGRLFCATTDCSKTGLAATVRHPADVGGTALTDDEMSLLILSADMGGQFFSRENAESMAY